MFNMDDKARSRVTTCRKKSLLESAVALPCVLSLKKASLSSSTSFLSTVRVVSLPTCLQKLTTTAAQHESQIMCAVVVLYGHSWRSLVTVIQHSDAPRAVSGNSTPPLVPYCTPRAHYLLHIVWAGCLHKELVGVT